MSNIGRCMFIAWLGVSFALLGCSRNGVSPRFALQRHPSNVTATQACQPSERTPSPTTIDSTLRPNIVQVVGDSHILGSGFLIPSNNTNDILVVTNYHVVVEAEDLVLVFARPNGDHIPISGVSVVKASPQNDLVLLKAPRIAAIGTGLQFSERVGAGQSVVSLAYPQIEGGNAEPVLASGLITQPDQVMSGRHFLQTNMEVLAGNSGGPAVDSCGKVLGVVAAHHTKVQHVGFLVPIAQVRELQSSYLAAHAPTKTEIESQLRAFVQSLQRDDGRGAAAYFSRDFLRRNILPVVKDGYSGASAKQERWRKIQEYLLQRGIRPEQLTKVQMMDLATTFDLSMSEDELYAYKSIEQSKQLGLDIFATLQAYLGPLLNNLFGRIDDVDIQDVREQNDSPVAHVVFRGPNGSNHYEITFARDFGQFQIAGLKAVNQQHESAPRVNESATAMSNRSTGWIEVARARRE